MRCGTYIGSGTGNRPLAYILVMSICLLASMGRASQPKWGPSHPARIQSLLAAIAEVESKNDPAVMGDGGHAIGPYQIHKEYWRDSGVSGKWIHCRDAGYARRVVLAYWTKYCPEALRGGNAEVLARVHNGGPEGHARSSTLGYWRRVQREGFGSFSVAGRKGNSGAVMY